MRPDVLLGHSDFVHRLCRSLLADREAAADVAQETLLEALRWPNAGDNGRAWLATVARNLARKAKRSLLRSARREAVAAKPERVVSTDLVLAREEERRRVVESVLALSEPYRTAILLRYFHDLPPRHIARELGVSIETVNTRLKRARQQLRSRLGEDPRREWTAFAWPIGWAEALWRQVAQPARRLGEYEVIRLGAVAATISLVALSVHWMMPARSIAPDVESVIAREPMSAALSSLPLLVQPVRQETKVSTGPQSSPRHDVFGRVMKASREGIDDVVVTLTNQAGDEHREEAFSGWFDLKDVAAGDWTLRVEAPWYWPQEQVFHLGDEELAPLEILMEEIRVGLRFETVKGRHFSNDWFNWEELFPDEPPGPRPWPLPRIGSGQIAVVVASERLESVPLMLSRFGDDISWRNEEYRRTRFYYVGTKFVGTPKVPMPPGCSGVLELESIEPCWVHLTFQDMVIASAHLEVIPKRTEELVLLNVDPAQLGRQTTVVKVQAIDAETGAPIQNVKVGLRCERWRLGGAHPATDEEGVVQIEQAVPGIHYLSLFHPEYESLEPYAYRVRIPGGGFHDLGPVRLSKRTDVHGVVKDAAGHPVEGALVWCERLDRRQFPQPLYADWVIETDEKGCFTIEQQGRGRFVIFAAVVDEPRRIQNLWGSKLAIRPIVYDNTGTSDPVEIVLQTGPMVSFRVERDRLDWPVIEVLDSEGVPVWYGELGAKHVPHGIRLAKGQYVVNLLDDMNHLETRGIEVGAEAMTVTFK